MEGTTEEAGGFREREREREERGISPLVSTLFRLSYLLLSFLARSNVERVPKVARHDHPADKQSHGAEEALLMLFLCRGSVE